MIYWTFCRSNDINYCFVHLKDVVTMSDSESESDFAWGISFGGTLNGNSAFFKKVLQQYGHILF